ncbi:MAG: glutathione synthase/RimK-type ligase-like ATP-grasp enzyme [Cyclobacteriaceae bacterium]
MSKFDITVLTDDRYESPKETNAYIDNLLQEDKYIVDALLAEGLTVNRKSWASKSFHWEDTRYALFRTTWDYFERFDEFIRWLGKASRQTKLINEFKLAQWNLDKHYLIDLQNNGVRIVRTRFVKPNEKTTLEDQLALSDCAAGAVLKPSISGAARHTYRLQPHNIDNHEAVFQRLIKYESMMIQPFLDSIIKKGEISLIVIDGKHTHAVLKKAKFGDFRVQDDFGGTVHPYEATPEEIAIAEKAVAACPYHPLYARVDLVWDQNDELAVSELELIEPELFFRNRPEAAALLAQAIAKYAE